MTFEQYRMWAKASSALAKRDYKAVESMLDQLGQTFSPDVVAMMLDTAVQDYQDYLAQVQQSRCEGYDAQSVWRKTLYMSFALSRMNRASADIETQAKRVRELCGIAS